MPSLHPWISCSPRGAWDATLKARSCAESAATTLPSLEPPYCFICSQPGDLMMRLCRRCWERPLQIDGIRSLYRFEGAIRNAVHSLKYRNLRAMAPVLAGLLADFVVSQSHRGRPSGPGAVASKEGAQQGIQPVAASGQGNRRSVEHGDKQ